MSIFTRLFKPRLATAPETLATFRAKAKAVPPPNAVHSVAGITGRQRKARAKRRKAARVARRITRRNP